MQKNYFIAQKSSQYSVRKQDYFIFLLLYKNVSQKNWFLYMNENYDECHHKKKCVRLYTIKAKKLLNVLYKKKAYIFQKARQFPLCFYIQKAIHLTLRDFHEILEVGIYIQKALHFALRDVFIYKKVDTSQKARQFAIRSYIQKSGTVVLRDFSLNF